MTSMIVDIRLSWYFLEMFFVGHPLAICKRIPASLSVNILAHAPFFSLLCCRKLVQTT